jgi:tRNA (mo5U34)-methyltransferase
MVPGPERRLDDAGLSAWIHEREWYHTMELRPGIITPGWFDTRRVALDLPWPSLHGKRCLDVGTFDGFWAFEMERRGGAEVVAIDVIDPRGWDWPQGSEQQTLEALAARKHGGDGFLVAKAELGSQVERRETSVYDLDPDLVGTFDVVYLGSILLHLRDPIRALERVRGVCRPDGQVLVVDAVDLDLSILLRGRPAAALEGVGRPWWWKPNPAGLARMVQSAGFEVAWGPRRLFMPPGPGQASPRRPPLRRLLSAAGREEAAIAWRGDPHACLVARV